MKIFEYLIPFVLAFGALIFFHELGHYLVARLCGVKVERFSIGFGKVLLKWRIGRDQTEWVLSAIPLGGYVKMLDEREAPVPEPLLPRAFNRQAVWKRFAIIAAGPLSNLLLALLLFWLLALAGTQDLQPKVMLTDHQESLAFRSDIHDGDTILAVDGRKVRGWSDFNWMLLRNAFKKREVELLIRTADGAQVTRLLNFAAIQADENLAAKIGLQPWPVLPAIIGQVLPGSAAARAGLQPNDEFIAANGREVASWDMLVRTVRENPEKPLQIAVLREGRVLDLTLVPEMGEDKNRPGKQVAQMGVLVSEAALERFKAERGEALTTVRYGVVEGFGYAARKTWEMGAFAFHTIGLMLTGELSWKNLAGPVTIADYAGQTAKMGWTYYLRFVALISISIGILNLLPIPILDGGHLLYYTIEIFKGSPVSERAMEIGQQIGLAALFMLMALAFYNDIYRILSG